MNYRDFFAENFCQTFSSILRKKIRKRKKLSAPILKSPVDQKHRFCVFSVTGANVYVLDQSDCTFISNALTMVSERGRRQRSRPITAHFLI